MKKVKDLEINFLGEDFKYTGEVNEKNIPHGKGKLISSGKSYVFVGEFVNGYKNGDGVESYNNNYFVKCNFINNFAYGKGECVTKNTLYKGEIVNSLKHGDGEFIKQKDAYELSSLSCEQKEILKHSDIIDGVYFLSERIKPCDNDEFSIKNAKFLNDQLVYGEMLFDNGNKLYAGQFEQKDFNGKARFTTKSVPINSENKPVNGISVYEGVFRKSRYCGKGLLDERYEKDGKKIIHIVKDDFMFGKPNGMCKDVLISEGKLHFYVGEMVNGLKDGKGEEKIYNVFDEDFTTDNILNHFDQIKKEFVYSFKGKWRNDMRNGLGVEKYSENEEEQTVIYDKDRLLKKVEK